MTRPLRFCTIGALLCILFTFYIPLHTSGTPDIYDKVLVHILHRHGAHVPIAKPGTEKFCDTVPCGQLTPEGESMLENAGDFFSKLYSNASNPLFPWKSGAVEKSQYNLSEVYSRSTDVDRTIQSAVAFLKGFFAHGDGHNSFAPAIHTVSEDMNTFLLPYLLPVDDWNSTFLFLVNAMSIQSFLDDKFRDWTLLNYISEELGLKDICDDYLKRLECALYLFDIYLYMLSSGELNRYTILSDNSKKLKEVFENFTNKQSYYSNNDKKYQQWGSRAHIFWKQVLKNMEDKISGNISFKMIHYSAHDITLTPIWGSLLDESELGIRPPFGQTLVVELLKSRSPGANTTHGDGKAAEASPEAKAELSEAKYYVHVLRGHPGQTKESGYLFEIDCNFTLKCVNSSGHLYNATDNTCPLEDFKRMLEKSAPTDPRGPCLLEEELVNVVGCPKVPVNESELEGIPSQSVSVSRVCAMYRRQCPEAACMNEKGVGGILDSKTLLCVNNSVTKTEDKIILSKALTVIVPLILFVVGLSVSIILGVKCMSIKRTKSYEEGRHP